MKKYTITDKEWESVLNKVQTLENENQKLTGVIKGMEKAFSLNVVVKSFYCWDEQALGKEKRCQEECETCASVRKEK